MSDEEKRASMLERDPVVKIEGETFRLDVEKAEGDFPEALVVRRCVEKLEIGMERIQVEKD